VSGDISSTEAIITVRREPRRSLAPHIRERWAAHEQHRRLLTALAVQREAQIRQMSEPAVQRAMDAAEVPAVTGAATLTTPEVTALRQRAEPCRRPNCWSTPAQEASQ
jgi:hypothetical protein